MEATLFGNYIEFWWLLLLNLFCLVLVLVLILFLLEHEEANPGVNLQAKSDGTQKSKISNVPPLPFNTSFQNANSFEYVYDYDSKQTVTKKMMVHVPILSVIIRHLWL